MRQHRRVLVAPVKAQESSEIGTVGIAAAVAGLIAAPIVGFSEYTLATTGKLSTLWSRCVVEAAVTPITSVWNVGWTSTQRPRKSAGPTVICQWQSGGVFLYP